MYSKRIVRTIFMSRVLLQLGIWIRNFAILLYVMEATGNDPHYVSLISVAEFGPIFLFAIVGGTFADRWRPKRTMVWCDLLSSASALLVLAAVANGAWQAVFAGTLVSASLSQFSQPSAMKMFKTHVAHDRLQRVMAMYQSMVGIFTFAGPILGATVFQRYGIESSLWLTAGLFLGSGLILTRLPREARSEIETQPAGGARPGGEASGAGSVRQELVAGLRYVRERRALMTLCAVFAAAGLGAGLTQPLIAFVPIENLGREKTFLQWLLMANGSAMLVGGAAVMAMARKTSPQLLLAFGLTISALCTAGTGFSVSVAWTIVFQAIGGLVYPGVHTGIQMMIMKHTEPAYIGRVSGAVTPIFMGTMVVGMFASGWLKEAASLPAAFAASAALLLAGAALLTPLLRRSSRIERGAASGA